MSWCEQRMVGMIPGVRIEIVDYLESTSCTNWDGGWIGKVPGV
jgi:hypothetical protein